MLLSSGASAMLRLSRPRNAPVHLKLLAEISMGISRKVQESSHRVPSNQMNKAPRPRQGPPDKSTGEKQLTFEIIGTRV